MRVLHCVLLVLATAFAGAAGAAPIEMQALPYAGPPAQAALYSFTDVYRLTVSGVALADRSPEAARGAALEAEVAPAEAALPAAGAPSTFLGPEASLGGYAFSIAGVKEPQRWLLLLSGIAAAAWVARRRLLHFS